MKNSTYDKLEFLAQILLPAFGTLYFALGEVWGLPSVDEVVGIIISIDAFLGVLLHLISIKHNDSNERFDGTMDVLERDDGGKTYSLNFDGPVDELDQKAEVLFKVIKS